MKIKNLQEELTQQIQLAQDHDYLRDSMGSKVGEGQFNILVEECNKATQKIPL
jgi:hypothetical protein